MAKTLIGQLILRLRTEGLGEAQKVTTAIRDVENAARRMGRNGVGSWGIGFQRQLDKIGLAPGKFKEVERSWQHLHDSMKTRNLSGALKSSEISHWKTGVISALAQARAAFDKNAVEMEHRARRHSARMSSLLRPGLVMMGAYTAPYFAGMLGSEALGASSERRREIFRQKMADIAPAEQDVLFNKSEELSKKYPSVPITSIMEMSRSAYSTMGGAERAAAVLERMVQSLVVMQSARGPNAAIQQLTGLVRGLDNLGINSDGQKGVDLVNQLIDAATKAAQVDPDFDPGTFFEFAKRTKVAGPALSPEFLARAPVYIQDMSPGATGNSLAMGFKAFVLEAVGTAGGKRYLAERNRIGIREDGQLVGRDMFGSDPDKWVLKYLVPALKRDGVDLSDNTAIAAAVGKLSGNTNATGFLTRILTQHQQVERWLGMMDKALGTDVAGKARFEDPFVGWESFKKSFENLSAALIPIDRINTGLNGLADGINALAAAAQQNPGWTALGMGAAGYAAYQGGKFAVNKMTDFFGLKSSALALDGSAAALTRAAVALGGAGVSDGVGTRGGKVAGEVAVGAGLSARLLTGAMGGWAWLVQSLGDTPGDTYEEQVANQKEYREHLEKLLGLAPEKKPGDRFSHLLFGKGADEGFNFREHMGIELHGGSARDTAESAKATAAQAGEDMQKSLSIKATPNVDTSSIDNALRKARELKSVLLGVDAAGASADRNLGVEMRRNFSDAQ